MIFPSASFADTLTRRAGASDNCAADLRGCNRTCATVGTRSPREDERFLRRCGGIVPWSWTVVRVLQIKSGGYPKVSRVPQQNFPLHVSQKARELAPPALFAILQCRRRNCLLDLPRGRGQTAPPLRAACQSFSTNSNVEAGKSLRSAASPQPNCSRALRGPPTS